LRSGTAGRLQALVKGCLGWLVGWLGRFLTAHIGVNAAGVTVVRTPPIFDLQGSIKMRWTRAIIATQSRLEAGEGKNERGGPPQYLKCVDAHDGTSAPFVLFSATTW